ncbi:MAG: acyl-CoA dehydrogenase [Frankiaceae bacterium]|nr:acyl-CoA dehydrogenase [Frankiaceae bacterium]
MPIGITEEHEALRAAARDLLSRHASRETMRADAEAETVALPAYWKEAAALGWTGLHAPEAVGGSGFDLPEIVVVVEELGRSVAPGPFVPTAHAVAVLVAARATDLLPGLVDGSVAATVAVGASPLTASVTSGGIAISGTARPVLAAGYGGLLLLPAELDGERRWCAVDESAVTVTPIDSLDPGRRLGEVTVDTTIAGDQLLDVSDQQVRSLGAVLYSAEAAGLAGWCLDESVRHAKERVQFGRPIGTFQAIKHKCADLLILVEQMRALAWDAARGEHDAPDTQLAIAAAAAMTLDGAVKAAEECIQILGGIGFTWEYDAHFYLRRALSVRQLLGPAASWRAAAAAMAKQGVRRKQNFELPDSAERYRAEVREFLSSIEGMSPDERRKPIVDAGYLLPHWPKPWGREADAVEQLVIDAEFRAAKVRRPNLAIGAWAAPTIIEHGTEEQIQRWVPKTMYGELSWCQLFSEPGAGSDLASLTTRAEATEGGWLITGQKVWTTMAREADFGILLARTSPGVGAERHHGISYFILDMKTPGIDIRPLRELTGQAMFNEVFFDKVFVPTDCLIGQVDDGWRLARTTLVNERVAMATGSSFGAGVEGVLRSVGDRELDPVAMDRIGAFVAEAQSLSLLGVRAMLKALGGTDKGSESSLRKLVVAEHDQRVQEFGIELLGAEGATVAGDALGWTLGYLSTRCLTIAGGTSEVQRNVIGERILGLPRDA